LITPMRDLADSKAVARARAHDEELTAAREAFIALPVKTTPDPEWQAALKRIAAAVDAASLDVSVLLSEIDARARVEAGQ
jgi:hypothetical protein